MIQGQGETEPRRCPRCGGLMKKPAGSTLYWHADYNHPRCDITNIVDSALALQSNHESSEEPPKDNSRKK
jgi:hypothetical protein